jgi:hypothetical protein
MNVSNLNLRKKKTESNPADTKQEQNGIRNSIQEEKHDVSF